MGCSIRVLPGGRIETVRLGIYALAAPISLLGAPNELQLNVTYEVLASSQFRLGLGVAIADLQFTFYALNMRVMQPTGPTSNPNTGLVAGVIRMKRSWLNPRSSRQPSDYFGLDAGVGRVWVQVADTGLIFFPIEVMASVNPTTNLTISGPATFPLYDLTGLNYNTNITIHSTSTTPGMGDARMPTVVLAGATFSAAVSTTGGGSVRFEVQGSTVTDTAIINLHAASQLSEFVNDASTIDPAAYISAPTVVTCLSACGGTTPYLQCLPPTECTGTCIGVCDCPSTSYAHYNYPLCTVQNGVCAGCLGGALCNTGTDCDGNCLSTTSAHYAFNCTTMDGVCSPACPFGDCDRSSVGTAGQCTCPSVSTTAWYSADCRSSGMYHCDGCFCCMNI